MCTFVLVLQDKDNTSTLAQKIKYQTIPRVGENIAYNDVKYEVIRVIHDLGYGEDTRTIVMVKPNGQKSTASNSNSKSYSDSFFLL